MKIFGIAGFKNAGKTTLVVELIHEFRRRGLRVATVKHAHHEFDIDHPGKDSHQHREAGAEEVIVASSRRWAHIRELDGRDEPSLAELLQHLGAVDLVLLEGFKGSAYPKLFVHRRGGDLPGADASVAAVVSDSLSTAGNLRVLPRADVKAIAGFVLQNAKLADTPVS